MALEDRVQEKFIIKGPSLDSITKGDTVATPSASWEAMEEKRELCRDLLDGTLKLREEGEKYLTRWEGEDNAEYKSRKDASVLVPFYSTAVGGLVDKVFSRPLRLYDFPPQLEEWWENVDHMGTHGDLFLRRQASNSIGLGLGAILVDHPRRDTVAQSKAEEDRQGLRPFFKAIQPGAILEARSIIENGRMKLERLRYYDPVEVPAGDWVSGIEERVVVLYRGEPGGHSWMEVWVKTGDNEWTVNEELGGAFTPPASASQEIQEKFREIPAVPFYTGDHGFWYGEPPLRALAEMNLQHYQKKSNFDTAVAISSVPMNAFIGWHDNDLQAHQWGPHRYLSTSSAEAKVQDISFSMSTADTALKDLDKLEKHMALAALDPQSARATGEEKSTIRLIDEAKAISRLQAWALQWLSAGQQALEWAGAWMGIEPERVGSLDYLEEVFDSLKATPDWNGLLQLAALVEIPPDVMIEEAKRFGILSDDIDSEELAGRIVTAGPGLDADSE